MSRPKLFDSRSTLVFQPNSQVYRPEADRCTRGFRQKDLRADVLTADPLGRTWPAQTLAGRRPRLRRRHGPDLQHVNGAASHLYGAAVTNSRPFTRCPPSAQWLHAHRAGPRSAFRLPGRVVGGESADVVAGGRGEAALLRRGLFACGSPRCAGSRDSVTRSSRPGGGSAVDSLTNLWILDCPGCGTSG
jgi:hypothetical protein